METRIRRRIFFAALALSPALSFANDHQLCYQKPPIAGFATIIGQFLCRTDGTTTPGCRVTGVTGAATFFHILPKGPAMPRRQPSPRRAPMSAPSPSTTEQRAPVRSEIQNVGLKPDYGQQNPGVYCLFTPPTHRAW